MLLRRMLPLLVSAMLALPLLGASGWTAPASAASPTGGPTYTWTSSPSPVVILLPQRMVRVRPYTYCWNGPDIESPGGSIGSSSCADGVAPRRARLATVERTAPLRFWLGRPGWRWSARVTSFDHPRRDGCSFRTTPTAISAQHFDIRQPRYRGTYRVRLVGRGPEGDMIAAFSWRYGQAAGRCS